MPSGGTAVRARKRTQSKGKAQPTNAVKAKAKAASPSASTGTHMGLTPSSVSTTSQHSSQTHTTVSHQQSLDVVQTFLFSAASTILWMRDLLPDDYFRTVFYASINKHCTYLDFTQGKDEGLAVQSGRSRPKGYHLRVLKRNVSTRGDQMIEWLETGAFEAIRRGYLDQLQICIFKDEARPTEVLEMYCFHFRYSEVQQDYSVAVNMEVEESQSKTVISLKDIREALNTVVRNMVGLNGTMPHLPERCYMTPYLVWNKRRPLNYQPPGFHSSGDINISFPATEGWTMDTSSCGQVKSNSNAVGLGIAYTKSTSFDDEGEAVVMPDFTYGGEFSRLGAFTLEPASPHHQDEPPHNGAQDVPTPRPSSALPGDVGLTTSVTKTQRIPRSSFGDKMQGLKRWGIDADANTQDKEDLFRLKALQPAELPETHDTQLVPMPSEASSRLPKDLQSKRQMADMDLDLSKEFEELVGNGVAQAIQSTPTRKRKDGGSPDEKNRFKTPRLSRPKGNLEFDSNAPYTPESNGLSGRRVD